VSGDYEDKQALTYAALEIDKETVAEQKTERHIKPCPPFCVQKTEGVAGLTE
jgi:hypothetical protein